MKLEQIVSGVFLLILAFLVLSNASAFNTVLNSASSAFSSSVTVLQGRSLFGGLSASPTASVTL